MKAVEPATKANPAQKKAPFFSKRSDHDFFGTTERDSSFFSKGRNGSTTVQTKLKIGEPDDKYEKEADSLADKVLQRMTDNPPEGREKKEQVQAKPLGVITPLLQTKCDTCEKEEKLQKKEETEEQDLGLESLQKKSMVPGDPEPPEDIQRKSDDCEKEEKIQKKSDTADSSNTSSSVENSLNSSKGSGSPIPSSTREQMESSFGADFSNVRVHTDDTAAKMSNDLNAQAFTHGNDIYFNSGKYDTSSSDGSKLLAHELTHTIQQGGVVRRKENPTPTSAAPAAAGKEKFATVSSAVVNISGSRFSPSEKIKAEIIEAGDDGLDVRVIVPAISEEGRIKIYADRAGNFHAKSSGFMAVKNGWAQQVGGLYLRFTVKSNEVTGGFVSPMQKGGDANAFLKKLRENSALLGGVGLKLEKLPKPVNEFSGDSFKIGITDGHLEVGGFMDATFNFILENGNKPKVDVTADVNVEGVAKGQLKLDNTKEKLTGEITLGVVFKDFNGTVNVKYNEDGSIDIRGKAAYNANKLSGEIDFVSTDLKSANNFAEDAIKAAGGKKNVQNAAPPLPPPAPKEGKKERALAAAGQLQFNLTNWFAGTVHVVVDGKGDITVIGKIAPPAEVELFKQRDFDKELVKLQVEAGYGIPVVGTIGLFAGVSLSAVAYIGPAKMYNIEILGTYSTDPTIQKSIQISGSINISAYAGLRLRAEGGAKLTIVSHDLKIGVGVNADVGVKAYADARPTIGYRDPGEFYISGTLEMVAQPMLGLSGDFFIELDAPWWSPIDDDRWTWPIGSKEWPLTDPIGLSATMKDYVLGSGTAPDIEFKKPEFDPSKFMTKMVDKKLPDKTGAGKEGQSGFKEDGSVAKPEVKDPKAEKAAAGADKKPGGKTPAPVKDEPKKTPPDPKAQQEAATLFKNGAQKLETIKGPITKADLRKELDNIEKGVAGIKYQIKADGTSWAVTASAKGVDNPKPFKVAAIVTDDEKKGEGKGDKSDNIGSALTEIDTEGIKESDEGEITAKEAEAIKNKVNADHPSVIKISSLKDAGDNWNFEYVQLTTKEKSVPKSAQRQGTNRKEIAKYLGKIAPKIPPEGYEYYDYGDETFNIRRLPGKVSAGFVKLAIEEFRLPGDPNDPGFENRIVENLSEGHGNRISIPGKLTAALGGRKANHQAHHVIPDAVVKNHKLMKAAINVIGYNLDAEHNGIMMPSNEEGQKVTKSAIHFGSHPNYNAAVTGQLDLEQVALDTSNRPDQLNELLDKIVTRIENKNKKVSKDAYPKLN